MDTLLPSPEEKRERLFLAQKETLLLFLQRGAISQAQFEKSYGDLCRKMKIPEELTKIEPERNSRL